MWTLSLFYPFWFEVLVPQLLRTEADGFIDVIKYQKMINLIRELCL